MLIKDANKDQILLLFDHFLFIALLTILPFHTVHGVLKARILKWFAIPLNEAMKLKDTWFLEEKL